MPLLPSSYTAPVWLPGGHAQTIFPSLFRSLPELPFTRTAIPTPDGDRIVLDTLLAGVCRDTLSGLLCAPGQDRKSPAPSPKAVPSSSDDKLRRYHIDIE